MGELRKLVSKRIEAVRKKRGLSQSEFGKQLKKSRSDINNWEQGAVQIKSDDLTNIVKTFNVSADYLLGFQEYEARDPKLKDCIILTGLSQKAVENIQSRKLSKTLSKLLENNAFFDMIEDLADLYHRSFYLQEVLNEPQTEAPFVVDSSYLDNLEYVYNAVRLQKFEIRDSFALIIEEITHNTKLLLTAKSILKVYGRLSTYEQNKNAKEETTDEM